MRRLALLSPALAIAAVLALGSAGAEGPARTPTASASASAIRISVPGQSDVVATAATAPPAAVPVTGGRFSYPADGSIVTAESTTATASATVATNAGAQAESDVTGLSLLGGAVTADAVTARASAGTGYSGAGGNFQGSELVNLAVTGRPTTLRQDGTQHAQLGDWGVLTVGTQAIDRTSPAGTRGYRGNLTELDLLLTTDYGGLPAGSEIQVGLVEAAAQTAPPAPTTTETTPTSTEPSATASQPPVGDSPRDWPKSSGTIAGSPLTLHPQLTAGRHVFPVYGTSSYGDSYGAVRADESYHHGDDIFGQLGQPLVACADGTVFSVGWTRIGGNRLWIRDDAGNEFYYAHLSAFSTAVANGAHVKAGQVVGFMGRTGDAEGTPVHLHFEVHPVSLLYLGYDGAVDPTAYLAAWQHARDLPFPIAAGWAPAVPDGASAPAPGAMLLGMSDISSADGLDPASLRRALQPPAHLVQPLVPTAVPRAGDLGADLGAKVGAGA